MILVRRIRKKYFTPTHPWQKERIIEEKQLIKEYGLKNHREVWKMKTFVKKAADEAKRLIPLTTKQAEKERRELLNKLIRYGLLKENATITDVLNLTVQDVAERRLQTLVYRKGLARSMKQARQFIVHKHIAIGDKVISSPSYLVKIDEEDLIQFSPRSKLSQEDHPERIAKVKGVINEKGE